MQDVLGLLSAICDCLDVHEGLSASKGLDCLVITQHLY